MSQIRLMHFHSIFPFNQAISPLLNSIQSFDKNSAHHKTFNSGPRKTGVKTFGGHSVLSLQASASSYPKPPTPSSTPLPPAPPQRFQPNFQQKQQFDTSGPGFTSGGNDLGTSSSQDSRRSQNENVFEDHNDKPSHRQKVQTPKPLLIEFEPPFLQPIFNTAASSSTPQPPKSTAGIPTTAPTRPQFVPPSATTPIPAFARPTFNAFVNANQPVASSRVSNFGDRLSASAAAAAANGPTTAQPTPPPTFIPTTDASPTNFPFSSNANDLIPVLSDDATGGNSNAIDGKIKEPPTVLLPPYESNVPAGIPTTQGPRVYHEWKLPASDLEPPIDENKSNGAITIQDDNQIPVLPPQQTTQQSLGSDALLVPPLFDTSSSNNVNTNVKLPALSLQPPAYSPQFSNQNDTDALQSAATNHSFPSFSALHNGANGVGFAQSTDKTQTQRSISPSASSSAANSVASATAQSTKRQNGVASGETTTRKDINYLDLKKQFLIPEYTFPLENVERPSYTESNAVNSFQIKIPDEISHSHELIGDGSSKNEVHRKPWYGENVKCPECHPTFLKPGSCDPCIKIR